MSVTVKTTSVKPAGIQWFTQANPAAGRRLIAWVQGQPGVLSSMGRVTAPNTFTSVTVFESQAAYTAFQAAIAANADAQARQAYGAAQNIQATTEVL